MTLEIFTIVMEGCMVLIILILGNMSMYRRSLYPTISLLSIGQVMYLLWPIPLLPLLAHQLFPFQNDVYNVWRKIYGYTCTKSCSPPSARKIWREYKRSWYRWLWKECCLFCQSWPSWHGGEYCWLAQSAAWRTGCRVSRARPICTCVPLPL